jgi:hypothetical protein
VLIRRTAITHDVDGDQRSVQLPITARGAGTLTLSLTSNQSVVPPGTYMLFINQPGAGGLIPSVSAPILVSGAAITQTADLVP